MIPPHWTSDSRGQWLHQYTEGVQSKKGKVNGQVWERQAKVNTFNSRLKLLISAHLCTINKVWGGVWKTAGTKFPLHSSACTLHCLPWEGCRPPSHPTLLMPHSHFVGATCIDFQFVSPWLRIISYMAKREFGGFSFQRGCRSSGGRLACIPSTNGVLIKNHL